MKLNYFSLFVLFASISSQVKAGPDWVDVGEGGNSKIIMSVDANSIKKN